MKKLYQFLCILLLCFLMGPDLQAQVVGQQVNFSATKDALGGNSGPLLSGSYQIRYGISKTSSTAQVTKPVILVEGWDPRHLDGHADIYAYLHPQLRADLYNGDYDVITLNFDYPDFSIGFNGMLLVELMERVNSTLKSGNEEAIVLGMSMGGLVARFGLKVMENLNIDHETRLYASLDSPHQGATLPKGLYTMASHIATANFSILNNPIYYLRQASPQLTELYHLLTSASVNEMLKNSNLHIPFQNEMDNLGYPENLRKVAVSNGSMRGIRQRRTGGGYLNPGDVLLDFNSGNDFFGLPNIGSANLQIRSSSPGIKVADLDLDLNIFGTAQIVDFDNYANAYDKPYEVNAGGYFALDGILGDVADVLPGFQNNMRDGFTFIPFASAFDIHPSFNHKLDIDLNKFNGDFPAYVNNWDILCYSPFDNIIAAPWDNEEHLEMTLRTSNWLMDEINGTPTATLIRNFCPINLSLNDSDEPLCDNVNRTIEFVDLAAGHTINWTAGAGLDIVGSSTGNSVQVRNSPFVSNSSAVVTATISTANDYGSPTVLSTTVLLGEPEQLQPIDYDGAPFPADICLTTSSNTLHFAAGVSAGADYYYWESDLPGFWGNISYGVAMKFVNVILSPGYDQQHYVRVKAVNSCGASAWTTRSFRLRYNPNGCSGSGGGTPGGGIIPFSKNGDLYGLLSLKTESSTIKLYNNAGKLIYTGKESYSELHTIDKNKVPDGHYFVHIYNGEAVIRKQIFLVREK